MKQPIQTTKVNLALSATKVAELFRLGVLCAADIECLDVQTRDQVQRLCLESCVQQLCGVCPSRETCSKGQGASSTQVIHWPNQSTIKGLIN